MADLASGLRDILGDGENVGLFIVDAEQALVMFHGSQAFMERLGDPNEIRAAMTAIAVAANSLGSALLRLPPRGWIDLHRFTRGQYIKFCDGEHSRGIGNSEGRAYALAKAEIELPRELAAIAQFAKRAADDLKGVRRGTVLGDPSLQRSTLIRDELIEDLDGAYARHIGEPEISGWTDDYGAADDGGVESPFLAAVNVVLIAAGLESIGGRQLRNVIEKIARPHPNLVTALAGGTPRLPDFDPEEFLDAMRRAGWKDVSPQKIMDALARLDGSDEPQGNPPD